MRREYLAQFKYAEFHPNNWQNAMYRWKGKRYAESLEEAKAALKYCTDEFQRDGDVTQEIGSSGLGVTTHNGGYERRAFKVVATKIKVREVSDWETVEVS